MEACVHSKWIWNSIWVLCKWILRVRNKFIMQMLNLNFICVVSKLQRIMRVEWKYIGFDSGWGGLPLVNNLTFSEYFISGASNLLPIRACTLRIIYCNDCTVPCAKGSFITFDEFANRILIQNNEPFKFDAYMSGEIFSGVSKLTKYQKRSRIPINVGRIWASGQKTKGPLQWVCKWRVSNKLIHLKLLDRLY